MLAIRTRAELQTVLAKLVRYQAKEAKYKGLVERYRRAVVRYFELRNMKQYEDADGSVWQKRQATRILYREEALRELLRKKNIRDSVVFKKVVSEDIDEDAILSLLKNRMITVEEYEAVVTRQAYTPFVMRIPPRKSPTPARRNHA